MTRVDIRRVLLAMEQDQRAVRPDAAGQLALGGLPKLMGGLRRSFRFTRAEAGKLGSLPVWIATGSWRPEALAVFAKDLADQAAKGRPLNLKHCLNNCRKRLRYTLAKTICFLTGSNIDVDRHSRVGGAAPATAKCCRW